MPVISWYFETSEEDRLFLLLSRRISGSDDDISDSQYEKIGKDAIEENCGQKCFILHWQGL